MSIYEDALVGGLLHKPEDINVVSQWLMPTDFQNQFYKEIYIAILELNQAGLPIDLITLSDYIQPKLPEDNVFALVAETMKNSGMKVDLNYYGKHIVEDRKRRDLTIFLEDVQRLNAQNKSLSEILEYCSNAIEHLYKGAAIDAGKELQELATNFAIEKDEELSGKKILKIMTHYPDLDRIIEGFREGNLVTIAAGSGVGKTTFGLNILRNVAVKDKIPVLLLSLEMGEQEILISVLSSLSATPQTVLKSEQQEHRELSIKLAMALRSDLLNDGIKFKIWCDSCDKFGAAIRVIRNHIKSEPDCKLVMIDYVGLMSADAPHLKNPNRVAEIQYMTRTLKNLAMELKIVILILAQINRNNQDPNVKPLGLNDLRDSSSFAHDANMVLFISSLPDEPKAKIIVAKNRNGPTGMVVLGYDRSKANFFSLSNRTDDY